MKYNGYICGMIIKYENIFPRCIYVAAGSNKKELSKKFDKFYSPDSEEEMNFKECFLDVTSFVCLVKERNRNKFGYLIYMNKDDFNCDVIAHESCHVVKRMEDYFEIERDANEYRAYFTGWIAGKIQETIEKWKCIKKKK